MDTRIHKYIIRTHHAQQLAGGVAAGVPRRVAYGKCVAEERAVARRYRRCYTYKKGNRK